MNLAAKRDSPCAQEAKQFLVKKKKELKSVTAAANFKSTPCRSFNVSSSPYLIWSQSTSREFVCAEQKVSGGV